MASSHRGLWEQPQILFLVVFFVLAGFQLVLNTLFKFVQLAGNIFDRFCQLFFKRAEPVSSFLFFLFNLDLKNVRSYKELKDLLRKACIDKPNDNILFGF